MEFDKIEYKTLDEASEASLKNSQDFQYEAKLLLKLKSYGHSKSLAILGIEEFGKSIGYRLLAQFKKIPIRGRIHFNPNELLLDLQKSHLTKQSIALIFTVLSNFTNEELLRLKRNMDKNGLSIEYSKRKKKFSNFENVSKDLFSFKKWSNEINLLPDLDRTKQTGLYVEINDTHDVNKPWKSIANESKKINQLLDKLLSDYNKFFI